MRAFLLLSCLLLVAAMPCRAVLIESTFEDVGVPAGDYYNGSDLAGGVHSGWAHFSNVYNTNWGSWSGMAVSSVVDTNTPGWLNQYAVWTPGHGLAGSDTYATVYDFFDDDVVTFAVPSCVHGFYVNNTTYAALAMLNGESPAKKFGGADGNDPDWLKLEISARDSAGQALGTVPFYLADYRATNNAQDYLVSDWTWVDLSGLGANVATLHFTLSSTDNGPWGMNTPSYFAFDGLLVSPRPDRAVVADFEDVLLRPDGFWNGDNLTGGAMSRFVHFRNSFNTLYGSWSGFAVSSVNNPGAGGWLNQYAVYTPGTGVGGGSYGVGFDSTWGEEQDIIRFASAVALDGCFVNNTAYAALAMLQGDAPSKKFGGPDGNDPDWFKLTISGQDAAGTVVGQQDVYLGDYRFANNAQDYIVNDWLWVDLEGFGPRVHSLHFALSSSDNGAYGMNTPSYFAIDDIRFRYSFSGADADANIFDGPVPGFVGRAGDGAVTSNNYVNAAFAGWGATVVQYAPVPGLDAQWLDPTNALGPVSGNQTDVVSLGDPSEAQLNAGMPAGTLTLRTDTPVADEHGPDLVVFENALQNASGVFSDLAFVEVSSDGVNFARFPSVSLTPTNVTTYETLTPEHLFNVIGKHANGYDTSWGTPFDLADLACHGLVQSGIVDLASIEFVRVVDIPGRGGEFDTSVPPRAIFDPWPTVLSGGADIDAVGVINSPDFARIATSVQGPGYIAPYGMPAGVVAVPNGSNAVFDIMALPGHHIIDVQVNGVSVGATHQYRFDAVVEDQSIAVVFGSRLTIYNGYAAATPFAGSQLLPHGSVAVSLAQSVVTLGSTQYVSQGWIGQGSAPTSGVAAQTGPFMLTNDTVVTWLWGTNYWLDLGASQGGSVQGASSGWYALGDRAVPDARADAFYRFTGWTGDTSGDTNALTQSVVMEGPRALRANFWAEVATNAVPLAWLAQQGLTNGPGDALAMSDDDGDGLFAWQEFYAGTDPNNPSSVFAVVDFGFENGSNFVAWTGGTNGSSRPFIIESCPRVEQGWQTVADAVSRSGSGLNIYWWPATNAAGFYRVGVSP